jgi:hypothetical protein
VSGSTSLVVCSLAHPSSGRPPVSNEISAKQKIVDFLKKIDFEKKKET